MLKIRLQRVGRRNDPSFRVVCTDSRKGPKSGNNVEVLGSYDPKHDNIAIKGDRVEHWVSQGAQVSDTVNNILVKEGIIKAKKKHVSRGKKNTRDLSAEAEAKENPKADEAKTEETAEEGAKTEAPVEGEAAPVAEEAPAEDKAEESKAEEAPKEDLPAEASAKEGEKPTEEVVEEKKEEVV